MVGEASHPPSLAAEPCQSSCRWRPSTMSYGDGSAGRDRLFVCGGCGSEWVRTELWTPADADGVVPAEVAAERAHD